jgi:hypothetical protein
MTTEAKGSSNPKSVFVTFAISACEIPIRKDDSHRDRKDRKERDEPRKRRGHLIRIGLCDLCDLCV